MSQIDNNTEITIRNLPTKVAEGQDLILVVAPNGAHNKALLSDVEASIQNKVETSGVVGELVQRAEDAAAAVIVPLGTYDASTGIATITATGQTYTPVLVADKPTGGYFDVIKPGTRTITGESVAMETGGMLAARASKWVYLPKSTLALEKVLGLEAVVMPSDSLEYVFYIKDILNKLLLGIELDGSVYVPKFKNSSIDFEAIRNVFIQYSQISEELKGMLLKPLDPATGFIWAVVDVADKILIACRNTGMIYIPSLDYTIPNGSISLSQLNAPLQALVTAGGVSNINNRVFAGSDNLIRSKMVEFGLYTSKNGAFFKVLPSFDTPLMNIHNQSTGAYEIRKKCGLPVRGFRYMGGFAVPAITEGTMKGDISAAPSGAGLVAGDYYRVGAADAGGILVIGGVNYYSGDLAVWDGSVFERKAAPNLAYSNDAGYWWDITEAGVFDGVSYQVGDKIYISGIRSNAGPKFRYFLKSQPAEYYFVSGFTPNSFVPATSVENVYYIADSAGNFDGKAFEKYDMVVRKGGAWSKLKSEPVTTIQIGEFFASSCSDLSDFEIRRADASNTELAVPVLAKSLFMPVAPGRDIIVWADSMGGAFSTFPALVPDRAVTIKSYGGARSEEILSMVEHEIRASGDLYKWRIPVMYHGQNNGNQIAKVKDSAIKMLEISGVRDKRFVFVSILGARNLAYNGTRFTCDLLEGAFAGLETNNLVRVESFYEGFCPGNYINIRKEILASAAGLNVPDIHFPGMTEAQVAATYGITPFSYHFDFATAPFVRANLVYKGVHSSGSAPTGGVDNDYYTSSFTGTVGDFWVKVSGAWVKFSADTVHVRDTAKPVYAAALNNWLITNKF